MQVVSLRFWYQHNAAVSTKTWCRLHVTGLQLVVIYFIIFLSIIYCFCFRSREMDSSVSVFSLLLCLLHVVTAQNGMYCRSQKHLLVVWNL